MNKHLITTLLLLIGFLSQAQTIETSDSLYQEVSPKGGINALAVRYYGIEFSKAQRSLLKEVEIEFIFQIDEKGKPTLAEINGTTNPGIIDSLKNKTKEIENFNPRIRNGIAEPCIYFLQLVFPTYRMTKLRFGLIQGNAYNEAKLKDFEYIKLSNSRMDLTIGGSMNQFIGRPSNYLKLGGGMKMNISFTDKRNYIYGLNTSLYNNKLKKEYPLNTTRELYPAPPTIMIGLTFGKWFNKFNVHSELNYAAQNLTEKTGTNDPDWIQLRGWSPAIIVNYTMKFGKQRPRYYYGAPSLFENNINLHFGLSYLFLSIPEASGTMVEIGVSYRMTIKKVKEYKLDDDFQKR